jgi:hypothetical protein
MSIDLNIFNLLLVDLVEICFFFSSVGRVVQKVWGSQSYLWKLHNDSKLLRISKTHNMKEENNSLI